MVNVNKYSRKDGTKVRSHSRKDKDFPELNKVNTDLKASKNQQIMSFIEKKQDLKNETTSEKEIVDKFGKSSLKNINILVQSGEIYDTSWGKGKYKVLK